MKAETNRAVRDYCELILTHLDRCRKDHSSTNYSVVMSWAKSIHDFAYQDECLRRGKIPVCGVYEDFND